MDGPDAKKASDAAAQSSEILTEEYLAHKIDHMCWPELFDIAKKSRQGHTMINKLIRQTFTALKVRPFWEFPGSFNPHDLNFDCDDPNYAVVYDFLRLFGASIETITVNSMQLEFVETYLSYIVKFCTNLIDLNLFEFRPFDERTFIPPPINYANRISLFPKLESISIHMNSLEPYLFKSGQIRRLQVFGTTPSIIQNIIHVPLMNDLKLKNVIITNDIMDKLFKPNPQVKRLTLYHCTIDAAVWHRIPTDLPRLEILRLNDNKYTISNGQRPKGDTWGRLRSLKILRVYNGGNLPLTELFTSITKNNINLGALTMRKVKWNVALLPMAIQRLPHLVDLTLIEWDREITESLVKQFLRHCRSLQILRIDTNELNVYMIEDIIRTTDRFPRDMIFNVCRNPDFQLDNMGFANLNREIDVHKRRGAFIKIHMIDEDCHVSEEQLSTLGRFPWLVQTDKREYCMKAYSME